LQYIVLGLLRQMGAHTGYDLKQVIDQSTQHFWYCDYSQIYRALDSLDQAGWVTFTEDVSTQRQRKIYRITPAGEAALKTWLAQAFEIEPARRPELARLFFGGLADVNRLREQVLAYREFYENLLLTFQTLQPKLESEQQEHPTDAVFWLITLDNGLEIAQAYINWCNRTLQRLETLAQQKQEGNS